MHESSIDSPEPTSARQTIGALIAPLVFGVILRDLVTLLRVCVFGWWTPRSGSPLELLLELGIVAVGAAVCSRVTRRSDFYAWLTLVVSYCLFAPPLGVYEPLLGGPVPYGPVRGDALALVAAAAAWWLTHEGIIMKHRSPAPLS